MKGALRWVGDIYGSAGPNYTGFIIQDCYSSALTLGGSVFRKLGLAFLLLSIPAEARFKLAGSEIVVRFHLSAERPPFRITRLDIPMIPRLGFPYLQENEKYKLWDV